MDKNNDGYVTLEEFKNSKSMLEKWLDAKYLNDLDKTFKDL